MFCNLCKIKKVQT